MAGWVTRLIIDYADFPENVMLAEILPHATSLDAAGVDVKTHLKRRQLRGLHLLRSEERR